MADKNIVRKTVEGYDGDDTMVFKAVDMGDAAYAERVAPVGPFATTASQITGQIYMGTTTTPVAGPNIALANGVWVKALAGNAGTVYVGNNQDAAATDFSSTDGWELSAGDTFIFQVANLNALYFLATASSDYVCWAKA